MRVHIMVELASPVEPVIVKKLDTVQTDKEPASGQNVKQLQMFLWWGGGKNNANWVPWSPGQKADSVKEKFTWSSRGTKEEQGKGKL